MSAISVSTPTWRVFDRTVSRKPTANLSPNEMTGYKGPTYREGEVQKRLLPISLGGRSKIWTPRDLEIYSNSAYVYAISPIALALLRGKGGREIAMSGPLSIIFAIQTHCLNTAAVNNYFCQEEGPMVLFRPVESFCLFGASR